MKTIIKYKEEFLKLAKELEKDYECPIKSIYIADVGSDDVIYKCDIEF